MTGEHEVQLLRLPVDLHRRASAHVDGVVRELALIASDPSGTPARLLDLARRLGRRAGPVMAVLDDAVRTATDRGDRSVDLTIVVPTAAADHCRTTARLFEDVDTVSERGGLLALPPPPDELAYRTWFLSEFVRQVEGAPPVAWPDSEEAAQLTDR